MKDPLLKHEFKDKYGKPLQNCVEYIRLLQKVEHIEDIKKLKDALDWATKRIKSDSAKVDIIKAMDIRKEFKLDKEKK